MKSFILDRLNCIGRKPICNLKCERAPKIGKFVFVFCFRCTGAILGGAFASQLNYWFPETKSIPLLFLSTAPLVIDGCVQKLKIKESTNPRRLVTGFLFGIGILFL
jgi:uncharacterized membrane protein